MNVRRQKWQLAKYISQNNLKTLIKMSTTTSTTSPSLIQRLYADMPVFWKNVHLFGLALVAIAAALSVVAGVPVMAVTIVGSIGGTLSVISEFAIKDSTLFSGGLTTENVIAAIPQIAEQVVEAKEAAAPLMAIIAPTVAAVAPAPPAPAPTPVYVAPVAVAPVIVSAPIATPNV
jgi:hypothetical protein